MQEKEIKNGKLIIALDVEPSKAQALVESTKDLVSIYKIGPVLWLAWGRACLEFFAERGLKVMIDFKFHDIPNTVKESIRRLVEGPGGQAVWGLTLHTLGGFSMLRTAALERDRLPAALQPKLFGVTVLTSLEEKDLYRLGINRSVEAQVKKLATLALDTGLDGVVSSVREVSMIRKTCGSDFLVLTPGISLESYPKKNLDQKRWASPSEALRQGSDHLIIGREIYQTDNPRRQVESIIGAMAGVKLVE